MASIWHRHSARAAVQCLVALTLFLLSLSFHDGGCGFLTVVVARSQSHVLLHVRGGGHGDGPKNGSGQESYGDSEEYFEDTDKDEDEFSNFHQPYYHTYYDIPFNPETQHFKAVIRPQSSPPLNPNPPPTFEYLQDLLIDTSSPSSSSSDYRRGRGRFSRRRQQQRQVNTNKVLLDLLVDQISGTEPGIVTDQYVPSRLWMWDQFVKNTLGRHCVHTVVRSTVYAAMICLLLRWIGAVSSSDPLPAWRPPRKYHSYKIFSDIQHNLIAHRHVIKHCLEIGNAIWKLLQGLTTTLLVVFVMQAYFFWMSMYNTGRNIQARMNDIMMLLATHSSRQYNNNWYQQQKFKPQQRRFGNYSKTSQRNNDRNINKGYFTYTTESEEFLEDIHHKMRLMHILWWAATARRYRILLTDIGMNRMVAKGLIRPDEKQLLDTQQLSIPRTQYYVVVLEWMVWKIQQASQSKTTNKGGFRRRKQTSPLLEDFGNIGFQQVILDRFCSLRSYYSQVRDKIPLRMPLALALYVQVLTDIFLLSAPILQYNELGMVGTIVSTVLLNVFYGGLLDIAFAMLDPFDAEGEFYHRRTGQVSPLYLDLSVLIRDTTAVSRRCIMAASNLDW